MFRKLLTVVLALALLALPMAGLAEAQTGYLAITILDPMITIGDQKIDLTGLEMDYSIAAEILEDASSMDMTAALRVLANGKEAFSAAGRADMEQAAMLVSGMTRAMTVRYEDFAKVITAAMTAGTEEEPDPEMVAAVEEQLNASLDAMLAGFRQGLSVASAGMDDNLGEEEIEAAMSEYLDENMGEFLGLIFEKLSTIEESEAEIEFFGEKEFANCSKLSFNEEECESILFGMLSLSGQDVEAFKSQWVEMGMSMTLDLSAYLSAGDVDSRVFVNCKVFEQGGEHVIDVDFDVKTSHPAENTGKLAFNMVVSEISSGETVAFNATADATPSAFDATQVDVVASGSVSMGDTKAMTGELSLKSTDANRKDALFVLSVPGEQLNMELGAYKVRDGGSREFGMTAKAAQAGTEMVNFSMIVTGEDSGKGDVFDFNGTLSVDVKAPEMAANFTTKFNVVSDPSIEGRMLDLSSIETVDLSTLTGEELQNLLTGELMSSAFGALSEIQNLPGIASMIEAMNAEINAAMEEVEDEMADPESEEAENAEINAAMEEVEDETTDPESEEAEVEVEIEETQPEETEAE